MTSWLLVCFVHPPVTPGGLHVGENGESRGSILLALAGRGSWGGGAWPAGVREASVPAWFAGLW